MAFTAYRTKAPEVKSELEKILIAREEYKKKLLLPDGSYLEDPMIIATGWVGEKDGGVREWPLLTYEDIFGYFNQKRGVDIVTSTNVYKEGKAYSFFKSDFVKRIVWKSRQNTRR